MYAQEKLSEEQIKATAQKMESDWRFGSPMVMWMESENSFNYYIGTAPGRCPDELEDVLKFAEPCYQESLEILQLEKQIYRKPGSKKWESSLEKYFNDTERAKKKFESARRNVEMYEKMVNMFTPMIEGMRKQTFKVPEGELVRFEFHSGGGMVRRPPTHGELIRQEDGNYIALLDTDDFDKLDTIAVTKEQVDEIRALLIEGEVYKMPLYYDTPVMLLDGPSSHVSVEFTDASYSCNSYPPSEWGGKNIAAAYNYLRKLHPKR